MEKVGFAVVGVRNFADTHINNIKKIEKEGLVKLTGVVVKDQVKNAGRVRELRQEGIKIFDDYEQLLNESTEYVDVIALPTSIHSHADMAIKGIQHGYNILLEKPPAPTVQQIDNIIKTEEETGKFCSIGFQFIHSRSIRKLKDYLLDNKIGDIKEIACKGYWPRYKSYYNRNPWAGKGIWNGKIVLDGPMHNAFAHFLNNMLFLVGKDKNSTAKLKTVRAELYRAHTYIDTDDTSCLEAETSSGTKIYFYVTHASKNKVDPYIEVIGDQGKAFWHFNEDTKIVNKEGEEIKFDNEGIDPWLEVIRTTAKVQQGKLQKPFSTPENSRNFVVAINGAYDSAKQIKEISEEYVEEYLTEDDKFKTELNDIDELMDQAFSERKLLSDLNIIWAKSTPTVNIEDYKQFNPFN